MQNEPRATVRAAAPSAGLAAALADAVTERLAARGATCAPGEVLEVSVAADPEPPPDVLVADAPGVPAAAGRVVAELARRGLLDGDARDGASAPGGADGAVYSSEEERQVADRLQALGYIE